MADSAPYGKPVLVGYIPEKFGERLVTIDADHPLAARLVRELPARRPVIILEGGEYDGQRVDLNECSLDYAMGQLSKTYELVDGDPPRIVAKVTASSRCPVCGLDTPHEHAPHIRLVGGPHDGETLTTPAQLAERAGYCIVREGVAEYVPPVATGKRSRR